MASSSRVFAPVLGSVAALVVEDAAAAWVAVVAGEGVEVVAGVLLRVDGATLLEPEPELEPDAEPEPEPEFEPELLCVGVEVWWVVVCGWEELLGVELPNGSVYWLSPADWAWASPGERAARTAVTSRVARALRIDRDARGSGSGANGIIGA